MDKTRLFVGNIEWSVQQAELWDLFAGIGEVKKAEIVIDRVKNRSRGFGFVEMSTPELATKAISELNGYILKGRRINVSDARPRI